MCKCICVSSQEIENWKQRKNYANKSINILACKMDMRQAANWLEGSHDNINKVLISPVKVASNISKVMLYLHKHLRLLPAGCS